MRALLISPHVITTETVEQARAFVAKLRDVTTQPVVYAELPFTQYGFDMFGSVRAAHAVVAVEQFLAEI